MATAKPIPPILSQRIDPVLLRWLVDEVRASINTNDSSITNLNTIKANRPSGTSGNVAVIGSTEFEDSEKQAPFGDFVGTTDDQTISNKKFGSDTNYSEFEDDGTLHFVGDATVWVDEIGQLIGQKIESPSSHITQNNTEESVTFSDACDLTDHVSTNIQINHDWNPGSDIYPHLHWWQTSSDIPNWMIQYRWQIQGEAQTSAWTSVKWEAHIFTYTLGTLNQKTYFSAITPPTGYSLSDIVQIRIIRDTANDSTLFTGADPLTGDVDALSFDFHIELDTIGSRLIGTK